VSRDRARDGDEGPPLGAHRFMAEVRELAAKKGFERFDVRYKRHSTMRGPHREASPSSRLPFYHTVITPLSV
jgi:hypothetical protein